MLIQSQWGNPDIIFLETAHVPSTITAKVSLESKRTTD